MLEQVVLAHQLKQEHLINLQKYKILRRLMNINFHLLLRDPELEVSFDCIILNTSIKTL